MNRKMCDRFREPKTKLQRMFCHEFMGIKCPSDTNSKCEIIPKKPKTRKIKAWACKSERGMGNIFAYDLAIERSRIQVPCEIVMLKTDYDKIRGK